MICVVGIGADGWPSLGEDARAAVRAARLLVGGERQLALVAPHAGAVEQRVWPKPLLGFVDELAAIAAERAVCVLASGDPMLHGIGATLARRLDAAVALRVIPTTSAFALACARLRWPAADVELVSAVGRPAEVVAPALQAGRRLLVYVSGALSGASEVARVACERGFGASRFVVLEELGGRAERITETTAAGWGARAVAPLHAVALEVRGDGPLLGRAPGLPDDAFEHDGQITKRDVRAITLAALVPVPGQLLWDVGAGSGSVAIEWLRAAPGARAVAIERDAERARRIARNALALGVPALRVVVGAAPAALVELDEPPDAIFVGGGVTTAGLLDRCHAALAPGGRLIANAVTVEGEGVLAAAHARWGGRLLRLSLAHAEPLGAYVGWRPAMTITQWERR